MTFEEFKNSLSAAQPPQELNTAQQALWYDGKNDWAEAHKLAQEINTKAGSWIHAYLHRKEGDAGNASYWYAKADKKLPHHSLDREWEEIVTALL